MHINHKDRNQLKAYFITDAVPTEEQFAELIDGTINQRDDGLVKQAGNPLCIEAAGDSASPKRALQLYESFADGNPAWTVSMNPRIDVDDPASARRGLSIHDASGASRFFVDQGSGRVGVGTIEPQATLHVAGKIIAEDFGGPAIEWRPVVLLNNWKVATGGYAGDTFATPGYYKDANGIVHFRGRVHSGVAASYTPLLDLPEGYRPEGILYFPVVTAGAAGTGSVMIMPHGQIRIANGVSKVALHLDSIHYRAHH